MASLCPARAIGALILGLFLLVAACAPPAPTPAIPPAKPAESPKPAASPAASPSPMVSPAAAARPARPPVELKFGLQRTLPIAAAFVALEKGYFAEQGIDLK